MYHRIQRKLQNILCSIDIFDYTGSVLRIKGWIFSKKNEIEDISVVLTSNGKTWNLDAETGVERIDVYNFHKGNMNAKNSGFYTMVLIQGIESGNVWIEYTKQEKKYRLFLGTIKGAHAKRILVRPYSEAMEYLSLNSFEEECIEEWVSEKTDDITIDVVIPFYNGYQYLDPLFNSIEKTNMKYRLILIDDCSPDKRVNEYLKVYQKQHPGTVLIENEENLGFVRSVNKGLQYGRNHVALVNTDVEVPEMWLERLMAPILKNDKVASSTPYTNAGTICSFPEIGEDNTLYHDFSLEAIDNEFRMIKPRYAEMPSGVGFCMGMNRKALDLVGILDEESFGKGYCEENDWCQRAIKSGMVNVHVENLYVYHKHGGSFLSEDKKRYIEEHSKILRQKYPFYYQEVALFFELDVNKDIRKYVEWKLLMKLNRPTTLVLNHTLGGGATSYLEKREQEILNREEVYCLIRCNYDIGRIEVVYKYKDACVKFKIHNLPQIADMLQRVMPDKIIINELVSYPSLFETLKILSDYRKEHETEMTFLVHDFYLVCPTVNLLNECDEHCGIPALERCEQCMKENNESKYFAFQSMKEWRMEWKKFIDSCDHVIAFSNDSKEIVEKAYGELQNIQVIPHKIDYLPRLEKKYKHTKTINIGLLGTLVKHKGVEIVKSTLDYIEKNNLDVNLVLVGKSGENIKSKHFIETGAYTRDMLPKLLFEYDIDLFWIASIWPETFSYTTEEVMTMNFPIMSFDLGAPAERIKKYEKGAIISRIRPDEVISTAMKLYDVNRKPCKEDKILFVVEEVTFSSRYRVDHLREQLLFQGITSDCVSVNDVLKTDLTKYESVVLYRLSLEKQAKKIIDKAHKLSKKVFYDIDDYIFEYDSIANMDFLQYDEYKDFKKYCDRIKNVMKMCDAYITSTNSLAQQISSSMDSDKVYVNRNVASSEMAVISLSEKCHVKKDSKKIILGYFSGTKTHDKDFELIKDVLKEILDKYDNVYLRMGGQIKFSEEFAPYIKRIETFEFMSWKKLPSMIAGVDINLMPLEDSIFHECKSENKWQEAALVGVPTIASYNQELSNAFEDGKEGFLCRNVEEWRTKLTKLIEDVQCRNLIADAAHAKVMREYITYTRDISDIKDVLCGDKK